VYEIPVPRCWKECCGFGRKPKSKPTRNRKWESLRAAESIPIRVHAWMQTNKSLIYAWLDSRGNHVKSAEPAAQLLPLHFRVKSGKVLQTGGNLHLVRHPCPAEGDDGFETPVQLPPLSINRATQPLWPTLIRCRTLRPEPERKLTKLQSGGTP